MKCFEMILLRNPFLMFYPNDFNFFFIERGFDERTGDLCLWFDDSAESLVKS